MTDESRTQVKHILLVIFRIVLGISLAVICFLGFRLYRDATGHTSEDLTIACSADAAGMIIRSMSDNGDFDLISEEVDYFEMGDCCGSHAQFALSTGEVDVAIMCPDAVMSLLARDEGFEVLGVVVYDGNVLVKRPNSPSELSVIGYMNHRTEQLRILKDNFGEDVTYQSMVPGALGYALENGVIDAAMLDVVTALKMGYPMQSISEGEPSSLMAVRADLIGTPELNEFIERYNKTVSSLNDEDLVRLLENYVGTEYERKEIDLWKTLNVWETLNVRFSFLTTEIS